MVIDFDRVEGRSSEFVLEARAGRARCVSQGDRGGRLQAIPTSQAAGIQGELLPSFRKVELTAPDVDPRRNVR